MDECFACFSEMCEACTEDGCDCSHSSLHDDPRPEGCLAGCSATKRLYSNAATIEFHHAPGCPHAEQETGTGSEPSCDGCGCGPGMVRERGGPHLAHGGVYCSAECANQESGPG